MARADDNQQLLREVQKVFAENRSLSTAASAIVILLAGYECHKKPPKTVRASRAKKA